VIDGRKVRLCPKRLSDATRDYAWQTDAELARLEAAIPLTASFNRYLQEYAAILNSGDTGGYQFAIDTIEGEHIGNCACYGIDGRLGEAEVGIIIGNRDYWGQGYGTDAFLTLVDYIFTQTELQRLFLKTLDSNLRAQRCFAGCGFSACGRLLQDGYSFVLMELYRHQWQEHSNNLSIEKQAV
jgi:RimJ/RimL family protein N-acetyltransferase